jgi:hypothetical protein
MAVAMHDAPGHESAPVAPRRRPLGRFGRRVRAVAVLGGILVLVATLGRGLDILPGLPNPFGQQTIDRSDPPLLLALADLEEFHAGEATFQEVVDIEKDVKNVPGILAGSKQTFLAVGTVPAVVDFGNLSPDAVTVSEDRRSATVRLPAPTLGKATIDPARSRMLENERGLFNRVTDAFSDDPSSQRELYLAGERRLTEAAAASELLRRAEENTRRTVTSLVTSLGFESVTVTFDAPPRDAR